MDTDKDLDKELEQDNSAPSMDELNQSIEGTLEDNISDTANEQIDDIGQTDANIQFENTQEDVSDAMLTEAQDTEIQEDENIFPEFEVQKEEEQFVKAQETDDIQELITVRPVKFPEFDLGEPNRTIKKNLDIMQDVSMHISVELGRAKSTIKEVMDYKEGSIVELDKIAGEQVEVYVNNKLVAKGEVIVIEDKFGVRVTSTNLPKAIQ